MASHHFHTDRAGRLGQLPGWYEAVSLTYDSTLDFGQVRLISPNIFQLNFLGNYKNPCWRESHDSPNLHLFRNGFINSFNEKVSESMVETLRGVQELWRMTYTRGGRDRVRCLPYFYLAGVTKSGTSDMWSELQVHPNITTGFKLKETQWWNRRALGKAEL